MADQIPNPRAGFGVEGLDGILNRGLPVGRMYLVQGPPGVGKTTLSLQFLLEGKKRGERTLYITLSETDEEVLQIADSHGWSLDGVDRYELSTLQETLSLEEENTLYAPADVELRETLRVLLDQVDRVKPARVVFDSLSEIRLLAQTPQRYRRQLLSLKQFFAGRGCTVLLLDDSVEEADSQIASIAHGVLALEQLPLGYGRDRRRLRVAKLRGSTFRSGFHDFDIRHGGVVVYPRLVAIEHPSAPMEGTVSSGVAELDTLLDGGLDRGTSTLLLGPAGVGKSALVTHFACAAAARGEKSALFLFDERPQTMRARSRGLGLAVEEHEKSGRIIVQSVDPAELSPDQFAQRIQELVDGGVTLLGIDSINGYFTAMPEARFLTLQMHELFSYTAARGVTTLMTLTQIGVAGTNMAAPVDVSYLADGIILFRYFESRGRLRKMISALKKRSGKHEDTIRELHMNSKGIQLGPPLTDFSGVLSGVPTYLGTGDPNKADAANS